MERSDAWSSVLDEAADLVERLRRDGRAVMVLGRSGDVAQGFRSNLRYRPSGSSGGSDPVGDLVASMVDDGDRDPVRQAVKMMVANLMLALRGLRAADGARARALGDVADEQLADIIPITAAGAGICGACKETVTGKGDDRLRSGYGPACYKAWLRAGRPDRGAFETDRQLRSDVA